MGDVEVARLVGAVAGFGRQPGSEVRVVARGSAEWNTLADQARDKFLETDQFLETAQRVREQENAARDELVGLVIKGLRPGAQEWVKERNPVWQARRAALAALEIREPRDPELLPPVPDDEERPEYAVVATAGDRQTFTVATFVRKGEDLRIVGAGSTHPGTATADRGVTSTFSGVPSLGDVLANRPDLGGRRGDDILSAEQLGGAVWYAVNRIAAREGRGVVDAAGISPVPATDGRIAPREPNWTASQVEELVQETSRQLPEAKSLAAVDAWSDDPARHGKWALLARDGLDNGVTVDVLPDDGDLAAGPRLVSIDDHSGKPAQIAVFRLSSAGTIVLDERGKMPDPHRALALLVGLREAARLGVGIHEHGQGGYNASPEYAGEVMRNVRPVLGSRLDDVPSLGWADAGTAGVAADDVAAAVARFHDAGGHVLRLAPEQAQYDVLQGRAELIGDVLERLSGENTADADRDPELAAVLRALKSPAGTAAGQGSGTAIAVAVGEDGKPLAAVGYRDSGQRIRLGVAGGVDRDALVAAIVDGPYREAEGRPVGVFTTRALAETYQQAGAATGGVVATDAEWLTNVQLSGEAAQTIVEKTDALRPAGDPAIAEFFIAGVQRCRETGAQLAVLSHARAEDRPALDHVFRTVPSITPAPNEPPSTSSTEPLSAGGTGLVSAGAAEPLSADGAEPVSGGGGGGAVGEDAERYRVTLAVVERGRAVAWQTVDTRPGRPVEVVDGSGGKWYHMAAVDWYVANHQARLGRDLQVAESYHQAMDGPEAKPADSHSPLAESQQLVNGVRLRQVDGMDVYTVGAGGEPPPSTNSHYVHVPRQPAQADQSAAPRPPGPDRRDRGNPGDRDNRRDRG
ncbi:hypothetical protein AB0E69_15610 [Kribbella sp. NPDC026611]|uniref:hypothetical protein n=1 Tax=Kribbella sp. NPDC026611 TaxID=3154911 RepID=UPI0033DDB904